jgi:hypothetical protein
MHVLSRPGPPGTPKIGRPQISSDCRRKSLDFEIGEVGGRGPAWHPQGVQVKALIINIRCLPKGHHGKSLGTLVLNLFCYVLRHNASATHAANWAQPKSPTNPREPANPTHLANALRASSPTTQSTQLTKQRPIIFAWPKEGSVVLDRYPRFCTITEQRDADKDRKGFHPQQELLS